MSVDALTPPVPTGTVWRLSSAIVAACGGAFAVSIWLYWDGLYRMWGWWIDSPEYSHALLIPPIAAFLIWQQKDRLERVSFTGSWWGVSLVFLGGALLVGHGEQPGGDAGILAQHQIGRGERGTCTDRHIFEVADRR